MSEPSSGSTQWNNTMGRGGFESVEYVMADQRAIGQLFERLGSTAVAQRAPDSRCACSSLR